MFAGYEPPRVEREQMDGETVYVVRDSLNHTERHFILEEHDAAYRARYRFRKDHSRIMGWVKYLLGAAPEQSVGIERSVPIDTLIPSYSFDDWRELLIDSEFMRQIDQMSSGVLLSEQEQHEYSLYYRGSDSMRLTVAKSLYAQALYDEVMRLRSTFFTEKFIDGNDGDDDSVDIDGKEFIDVSHVPLELAASLIDMRKLEARVREICEGVNSILLRMPKGSVIDPYDCLEVVDGMIVGAKNASQLPPVRKNRQR